MKKRKDSALGIHFDFHVREGMTVADIYSPELIGKMLDRVQPDFVQCDTKGHPGLSSYPTKVGNPAPDIRYDILKMWRSLTEERNIALYAHHSGLFDMKAALLHPDWAVVDSKGNVSDSFMSVFGPYADELLIPQIKELAGVYKLDGVWVDGESWGAYIDHSVHAQKAYFAATGKPIPREEDEDYENFKEFNRLGFLKYVEHYISEVKKAYPDFQITSNWIFSEYMLENAKISVDYLSGDYDCANSVNSARHHARVLAAHKLPWDLMAWGQNTLICDWKEENRQNKEPEQLMQEAAVVIVLGGCFEFFDILYGHGSHIQDWCIEGWGQVADFVRARESICFGLEPVHQLGFVFPASYPAATRMYDITESCKASRDTLLMLQDAQFSTEVLFDDALDRLGEYELVFLPGAENMTPGAVKALEEYVSNGGKLIVDLPCARYFSHIIDLDETEKSLIYVDGNGRLGAMETECVKLSDGEGAFYENNYYEAARWSAYKKVPFGKGCFVFNCFDISGSCSINVSAPYIAYIKSLVAATGFVPTVRILNNSYVDVTLARKDGRLLVNLVNMSGCHNVASVRSFAQVPVLCDIELEIDYPCAPKKVIIEPGHKSCEYTYDGKTVRLTLDRLHIHSVVEII
ncbi:MAG: hypothetical protein IJ460_04015 [Clostridia bacterium]|nr:hypothetical protein [Clostridia bacterium]